MIRRLPRRTMMLFFLMSKKVQMKVYLQEARENIVKLNPELKTLQSLKFQTMVNLRKIQIIPIPKAVNGLQYQASEPIRYKKSAGVIIGHHHYCHCHLVVPSHHQAVVTIHAKGINIKSTNTRGTQRSIPKRARKRNLESTGGETHPVGGQKVQDRKRLTTKFWNYSIWPNDCCYIKIRIVVCYFCVLFDEYLGLKLWFKRTNCV